MEICDYRSLDPPGLRFELPGLYCEPKEPNFYFFMVSCSPEAPITEASIAIKACELACKLLLLYSLRNGEKFIYGLHNS
jgi:hypothetical protein